MLPQLRERVWPLCPELWSLVDGCGHVPCRIHDELITSLGATAWSLGHQRDLGYLSVQRHELCMSTGGIADVIVEEIA